MNNKIKKLLAVITILIMVFCLASCGAAKMESAGSYDKASDSFYFDRDSVSYEVAESEAYYKDGYDTSISSTVLSESYVNNSNAKLIYTANIDIQTLNLQEEYEALVQLVKKYNGYFESSSTQNGGYYDNSSYRYGYYTVRIPKENYSEFVTSVKNSSYITNFSESVKDVGEKYFDLENRLETLRTKEERLQELLKQAKNVSEIIEIESALTDVEYQINSYQTDLNHYDSLIDYSTINFEIQQVVRVTGGVDQGEGFFEKLGRSFATGWHNFVDGLGDFANWIVYNIFTLIIIAAILFVVIRFQLLRKFFGLFRRKDKKDKIEK